MGKRVHDSIFCQKLDEAAVSGYNSVFLMKNNPARVPSHTVDEIKASVLTHF